jgi:Family of unknown function (DUF6510)
MGEHLDGNDMAGALSEIFAVDVSSATSPCPSCRRVNVVAELRVYGGPQAPGLVARCGGCDEVVLRLVCGPNDAWLDLRATLRIPLAPG